MSAHDRLMTAPELAKALGLALRTVQVRAQREAWPTMDDPSHSQRKLFKFSDLPPTVQAEIIQREETVAAAIAKHEASVADAERVESKGQRDNTIATHGRCLHVSDGRAITEALQGLVRIVGNHNIIHIHVHIVPCTEVPA